MSESVIIEVASPDVEVEILDVDADGVVEVTSPSGTIVDIVEAVAPSVVEVDTSTTPQVEVEAPTTIVAEVNALPPPALVEVLTGALGPRGATGETGETGAPGPSDNVSFHYTHTILDEPEWDIVHNLGYRPAGIVVQDSGGTTWEPDDIEYVDENEVILRFRVAGDLVSFTGDAWLS